MEGFSPRDKVNLSQRYIPRNNGQTFADFHHNRIFCGSISKDGKVMMAASQGTDHLL